MIELYNDYKIYRGEVQGIFILIYPLYKKGLPQM